MRKQHQSGAPTEQTSNVEVRFTVLGRGQQRGSKQASLIPQRGGGFVTKNGRPVIACRDMNARSKDYMQEVRSVAYHAMEGRQLLIGPIELTAVFYFARPKAHFGSGKNAFKLKASAPELHAQSPDLAKLLRCLEDALTGIVWRDDRQVFRYGEGTERQWCTDQERVEVLVREFGQA